MKTIVFKFKLTEDLEKIISHDSRICSSIVRYSFNRFRDGISYKEIYNDVSQKFEANCHLKNSSIRNAQGIHKLNRNNTNKIYFGQFKRFQHGLISKEDYKISRNCGIISEGESNQKGNRLFQIDVVNNKIIYKRSRTEHLDLLLDEKLRGKRKQLLSKIQYLSQEKKLPITIKIKNNSIYLTYDEKIVECEKKFKNLFNNRVLGIDLNPNYFGISIIEFDYKNNYKIIHKEAIDITNLQHCSKEKIKFELYQINHQLMKLCKTWHVSKVACEDLEFDNKKKYWNKDLNRLCKNQFRFGIIKSHLQILCNTFGIEFIEVNAAYSSIIGNFQHGSEICPDPIAASIEIARRAYKKFEKGWFQPKFITEQRIQQVLENQWKEELRLGYMSWKGLAGIIKKSKLKYRFQLQPSNAVFSKNYIKKRIFDYIFL